MISHELDQGRALRDVGISAVDAAGVAPHKQWRPIADGVLTELISEGKPFTADDLARRVPVQPEHPNQVGALIMAAARQDRIRKLGYRQSTSKTRRAGAIALWQPIN